MAALSRLSPYRLLAWILLTLSLVGSAQQVPRRSRTSIKPGPAPAYPLQVSAFTYDGWPNSLILSNGQEEVVVVPAIGRVMQFHYAGEGEVLFENRSMDGKPPDPASKEWGNFGGDKTWPSPQADWEKVTGRSWPPPVAFDSMPVTATVRNNAIELTSEVDPAYGIRTHRRIELDDRNPIMTIETTYEKVSGEPLKVGVWAITQMADPERAFMVVPAKSQYPQGYNKQMDALPKDLNAEDGLISMTRDPKNPTKIGSDGGTLIWMNDRYVLRIDSPRVAGAEYPDQGSSEEIYTNPDPLTYIELETLGPLSMMQVGDKIERMNKYTLLRRTEKDPTAEVKKILGPRH
jgi:Domain of unknown function (DUF4380)